MNKLIAIIFSFLILFSFFGCAVKQIESPLPVIQTPKSDLQETINGYRISDPYRWLEDGKKAEAWIEKQNNRTIGYLETIRHPGISDRIAHLFEIGYVGQPKLAGNKIFYMKLDEDGEQPRLVVFEEGKEKILIAPDKIDPTGKTALDWYYPSRTGRYVAYGLSTNGDEMSTLFIMDVISGQVLADQIINTQHCSLAWKKDDSGFYYTRYADRKMYNRHVYFHRLNDDPKTDPYVYGKDRKKTDWPDVHLSQDDKYLFIDVGTGTTTNDSYVYDLANETLVKIFEGLPGMLSLYDTYNQNILAITTYQSPNGRVVSIDPNKPAPENWQVVLSEKKNPLKDYQLVGNKLIVHYLENAASKIRVYSIDGEGIGEVVLPAAGTVGALSGEPGNNQVVVAYSSFLYPQSLFTLDVNKSLELKPFVVIAPGDGIDPSVYRVQAVEYPSYDGTYVPLYIVHRKDIALDGANPALLYGYGGFGIARGPYFSRTNLFWIERGGVFAIAGIRGGDEKGETWHQAGMLDKKYQVYEDFKYAMAYLIRMGYTRPEKLAIRGGSNGGLLVGAMLTRNPHMFGCAVSQMGLYDMVRYHKFPPGELWVPEYGKADNPAQTGYLWAYSPYHQVLPGVDYPATFLYTAESDTRVPWLHTAKFAAALQGSGLNHGPILFLLQRQAGHGQGMNLSDLILETAQMYDFILEQIGDPQKP